VIIKEHTRNQKRMYRIHKMEEQIEKDKYIIGNQQQEIERLNNIIDELEKYMIERRLTDIDGRTMVYQILYKLNELKGDNK